MDRHADPSGETAGAALNSVIHDRAGHLAGDQLQQCVNGKVLIREHRSHAINACVVGARNDPPWNAVEKGPDVAVRAFGFTNVRVVASSDDCRVVYRCRVNFSMAWPAL